VSGGHRVFVLRAVKLETRGDSQRERCIRALCGRVSEKGEVKCLSSIVHESGLRELISQSVIGALLAHDVQRCKAEVIGHTVGDA